MFNIGDKVMVYRDHHDKAPRQQTVARVSPRKVVLGDGSAYTISGYQWGDSKGWFRGFIKHLDADLLAELQAFQESEKRSAHKKATIKAIVNFVSYDMATDELDRLAAQLHNMGMPKVD